MFFISMTVIGLLAAFRLPLEYMPDIEAPFLFINVPIRVPRRRDRAHDRASGRRGVVDIDRHPVDELGVACRWRTVVSRVQVGQNVANKAVEARDKIDAIRADSAG
jgi:HAE1 family hydrophobic/amphiphilic exporter-1